MAKTKTSFFCQSCGYESPKWVGKCPSCQEWNSFVEEVKVKEDSSKKIWQSDATKSEPVLIDTIDGAHINRIASHDNELDRVLGGGIVPGSLVLIGGEPGIGKSTLMLQLSLNVNLKTLYVSGEESEQQIKLRADRISSSSR
jgi:DNA repair protein RadA/Sms